jgi:hypothetical protein
LLSTPKAPTLLDAKHINQLITENINKYSQEEWLQILADVSSQMKKLL